MLKPNSQNHDVIINTPFGVVGCNIENDYLTGVKLFSNQQAVFFSQKAVPNLVGSFAQYLKEQITQYFQDAKAKIDVPFKMAGTPFQERVWQAIADIPPGRVMSYSALAHQLGSGPRAVANACGANELPLIIPCHRVVSVNGLGGFMRGIEGGLAIKEWLLAHESR